MSTIVKYHDKKRNRTLVYESASHYDPVTKQSRPKRKYLGMLDPETGELIPTSGRPGRRPGPYSKKVAEPTQRAEAASKHDTKQTPRSQARNDLPKELEECREEVRSLKTRVAELEEVLRGMARALAIAGLEQSH